MSYNPRSVLAYDIQTWPTQARSAVIKLINAFTHEETWMIEHTCAIPPIDNAAPYVMWAWGPGLRVFIGPPMGEPARVPYSIKQEIYDKPEDAAAVIKDFVRSVHQSKQ
jgi:hypothetical protein